MAQMRLLQVSCTVALLAAAPAFAQNTPQTGSAVHDAAPTPTTMPAGSTADSPAPGAEPAHKMATHHHAGAMHSSKGGSQDAMVDKLNEQSYQAAQQGQPFTVPGSAGGGGAAMTPEPDTHTMPAGSGKM
jgi:hypothetical protein